jgi:ATP-binding cassette subfamily B protein
MSPLTALAWPADRLGEALEALARRGGLVGQDSNPVRQFTGLESCPTKAGVAAAEPLRRWVESAAARLGLEAEPVEVPHAEVGQMLRGAAPALLRLPGPGSGFLALLAGDRRHVTVLTPGHGPARVPLAAIRDSLCSEAEGPVGEELARLLHRAGIRGRRAGRARQAVLHQLLGRARVGGCWVLRPAASAGLRAQAREARLPRLLLTLLGAHTLVYGLWLLSWWLLGWAALQGRLELGWLLAWLLLLLTTIPLRLLTNFAGGLLSIRAGTVLKRRLLAGALRMEADEVRHLGVGQLLGRVLESEVVETTAVTGGFLGLTALVELVFAGAVLGVGAGSAIHVLLLLATAVAAALLLARAYRRRRRWTAERLDMTNDLVESMVGHRTRLAQEARRHWNDGEDEALERYLGVSAGLDRSAATLQALVPRGWFLLGLVGLVPAFVVGNRSAAALAVGVGGVVLAYRALRNLVDGLERLAAAAIAWERVRPFWQAAARREAVGDPCFAAGPSRPAPLPAGAAQKNGAPTAGPAAGRRLLVARDLVFRYRDRQEPVLHGVEVGIAGGDRLLLEGPSGGGKSTLASVLAGCRAPDSGLLLLDGLDPETLGSAGWRRRVVLAPQFHDNHVLMGTFAFNVLMGRRWPPRPGDLEEAEQVCRALGLGPLLERMPAGLHQTVGNTGWQLSHGERSRLYVARALLQGADVLILDESFAALDPQTLQQTLAYVLEKAPALLVIAHP